MTHSSPIYDDRPIQNTKKVIRIKKWMNTCNQKHDLYVPEDRISRERMNLPTLNLILIGGKEGLDFPNCLNGGWLFEKKMKGEEDFLKRRRRRETLEDWREWTHAEGKWPKN